MFSDLPVSTTPIGGTRGDQQRKWRWLHRSTLKSNKSKTKEPKGIPLKQVKQHTFDAEQQTMEKSPNKSLCEKTRLNRILERLVSSKLKSQQTCCIGSFDRLGSIHSWRQSLPNHCSVHHRVAEFLRHLLQKQQKHTVRCFSPTATTGELLLCFVHLPRRSRTFLFCSSEWASSVHC